MPENVRHRGKFTTDVLWKMDNLEDPPNITGKIKRRTPPPTGQLSFFGTKIHTKQSPHHNQTENAEARTSEYFESYTIIEE